jgi:hypothetical protein
VLKSASISRFTAAAIGQLEQAANPASVTTERRHAPSVLLLLLLLLVAKS